MKKEPNSKTAIKPRSSEKDQGIKKTIKCQIQEAKRLVLGKEAMTSKPTVGSVDTSMQGYAKGRRIICLNYGEKDHLARIF